MIYDEGERRDGQIVQAAVDPPPVDDVAMELYCLKCASGPWCNTTRRFFWRVRAVR